MPSKTPQRNVRLDDEFWARVVAAAARKEMNVSAYIRWVLTPTLERSEARPLEGSPTVSGSAVDFAIDEDARRRRDVRPALRAPRQSEDRPSFFKKDRKG